jgi:glycine dehydrogenase
MNFVSRHIGPNENDIQQMLDTIGCDSLDQLIKETIPEKIRLDKELNLPEPLSEHELLQHIRRLGNENIVFKSYIGMGYYGTITPSVIRRNILENPGWYTAYTPYQAEISQGRLEALINFQTVIIELTGLPITNASLLDEGTAAAEAMHMLYAVRKPEKANARKFFVSQKCFPQTIEILKTRAEPQGIELIVGNHDELELTNDLFGILVQYPTGYGEIYDYTELFNKAHSRNIYTVTAADILSLTLLKPPGEFGSDVAVGSTQRFGVPMGYGGPHAAYFSCKDEFKRLVPGRIIGASIDVHGNRAYRMALQTREQHIRREKATSNICTAQVLLAVMAGMYAAYHGPKGLKAIAEKIHSLTAALNGRLKELGYRQLNDNFFDTLMLELEPEKIKEIRKSAEEKSINFAYIRDRYICISLDETTTEKDVENILTIFKKSANLKSEILNLKSVHRFTDSPIDTRFRRASQFLSHPIFNSYHSETEMMRYIKRLENKDLALNTAMIPLGSCTMKLNAATEMLPVTWNQFSNLHPFAPAEQAAGYHKIFKDLEDWLKEMTGLSAVSLQPNSGAQGEFTGLLVIRSYHKSRGEGNRNVVLIPASAHGTNPASAVMAGMKVVVVKTTPQGDVDIEDLKAKAEQFKDNLAALMVTYPSTHGVFEECITEVCKVVHENGGQVYMDGANLNAQIGLTSAKLIGADVIHINLHKTFCIPHGGGGPGMGPIAVAKHLSPFLPSTKSPLGRSGEAGAGCYVSSAPYGSANILLISYAYILMMGADGLKLASEVSILNANYVKSVLEKYFAILYTGKNNRVGHEFIFDMRPFKQTADIGVEDIAKRLIDYTFHAPTVSFPVPGTLMFEPTESESKYELDRFCEAMISIRGEMKEIEEGLADRNDNVLKNSPHTAGDVVSDAWNHPYTREKAAYPTHWLRENKFWAPVGRVDNAYGDRNFVCSCEPVSEYVETGL